MHWVAQLKAELEDGCRSRRREVQIPRFIFASAAAVAVADDVVQIIRTHVVHSIRERWLQTLKISTNPADTLLIRDLS